MADEFDGFFLPIKRRGKFSKDDYFKGFQDDYDSAIDKVMDRFGARSMLADQFSNYRKMREKQDDTEVAASISETDETYAIVIDISDYVNGSLTVRTRGKNAIVDASFQAKTFHKVFPLPTNTNTDAVKTAMSDEGILTITAPKMSKSVPASDKDESDQACAPPLKVDSGTPEAQEEPKSPQFPTERTQSEHIRTKESAEDLSEGAPQSPVDKFLSINRKGKFFQDRHFENVWNDFEKAMNEMVDKERERKEKRQAEREARRANLKEEISRRFQEEMLPRRVREDPDIDAVLKEFGIPEFGRLSSYRNLRHWVPNSDTQAVTVTKDSKGYKIVMDVKDHASDGELSVKASEGILLVSAGKGRLTFEKEFSLPGLKDTSQVNASLSEDGVLTIIAPV